MNNEDLIKRNADKRDKRRDQEFADEVLDILRKTHEGDGFLSGTAATDPERLAAILAFLQAQAREVLSMAMRHPEIMPANSDRVRVAYDACEMLYDIVNLRRHPIHKFFRGSASLIGPTDPSSRKFIVECHLIACVEALLDTKEAIKKDGSKRPRTWATQLMREHPGLKDCMPGAAFNQTLTRKSIDEDGRYPDAEAGAKIKYILGFLKAQNVTDPIQIMNWTSIQVAQRERPIDFAAASAVEVRRIMIASPLPEDAETPRHVDGGEQTPADGSSSEQPPDPQLSQP